MPQKRCDLSARATSFAAPGVWVLAALHGALPWLLPMLPGQDLPQHLSYARIIADIGRGNAEAASRYELAQPFQASFLTHYALAWLSGWAGILGSARLVFSLYAVATTLSFQALANALRPSRPCPATPSECSAPSPWPRPAPSPCGLLSALIVWNPALWMGFLPFVLCLPFLLASLAALLLWLSDAGERSVRHPSRSAVTALAAAALVTCIHVVAGTLLAGIGLALAAVSPQGNARRICLAVPVACCGALAFCAAFAGTGVAPLGPRMRSFEVREGLGGLTLLLGIDWGLPLRKLEYVSLAFLGTLSLRGKATIAAAAIATFSVSLLSRRPRQIASPPVRSTLATLDVRGMFGRALCLCWGMACLVPASLRAPSDISFLDYRVVAYLAAITLPAIDPTWFSAGLPKATLLGFAAIVAGLWTEVLFEVGKDGANVLKLVQRLDGRAVLLALPFGDEGPHVDEDNSVGHYWATMHTALNGGISSQFWGRFSDQLPVAIRPGQAALAPADWRPWEVSPAHFSRATHALVSYPNERAPLAARLGAESAREWLGARAALACEGRHCLYTLGSQGGGTPVQGAVLQPRTTRFSFETEPLWGMP